MPVYDEYSPLLSVAVGTTAGMRVPEWTDYYATVDDRVQDIVRRYGGRVAAEVPELADHLAEVEAELAGIENVYAAHGVKVQRVGPINDGVFAHFMAGDQAGGYSFFPADPLWVIGRNLVECRLREPARNRELFAMRPLFGHMNGSALRYVACPISNPQPIEGEDEYFLEGGDIVIDGARRHIYVGVDEGRSTSQVGAEWLARTLAEDNWGTTLVPLSPDGPLHLLGSVCFISPDTLLAYEPAMRDGMPAELKSRDVISLTLEETRLGAPCTVMLDPVTALVSEGLDRVSHELEQRGITVITTPTYLLRSWDGAIRCATAIIERETPAWAQSPS